MLGSPLSGVLQLARPEVRRPEEDCQAGGCGPLGRHRNHRRCVEITFQQQH